MSDVGMPAAGFARGAASAPAVPAQAAPPGSREPQPAGTWKVGSLHPTAFKVLTVLSFAIPVGAYLAMLAHYQVNVPWTDEWGDVHVLVQNYGHFPDWSSLWALHSDNRVFFPNLIVIGLAHMVSFNIEVEEYLSALMLFGSVALLIWAHKRRSLSTPLLFYCPVAFVMLTLAQSQNTLWGFQLAWYLVLLSLALSVVLLDRPTLAWPVLVGAALVAVVGSYLLRSRVTHLAGRPRAALPPSAAGVGIHKLGSRPGSPQAPCTFTTTMQSPSAPSTTCLRHLLSSFKLFLFALGDVVGLQTPRGGAQRPGTSWRV